MRLVPIFSVYVPFTSGTEKYFPSVKLKLAFSICWTIAIDALVTMSEIQSICHAGGKNDTQCENVLHVSAEINKRSKLRPRNVEEY